MIVNSSRGGGSKDTWVLEDSDEPELEPARRDGLRAAALPDLRLRSWTGQAQQQQQSRQPSP